MPSDRLRVVSNLVAIPLGIAMNSPGGGPRELVAAARADGPLLAASPWTFAIWGLIFGGQTVYAAYQALPRQRRNATLRRIGYATALNGLLGGAWAAAFVHGLLFLSWVVLLALLANLLLIEHRLGEGARAGRALWLVRIPFGLYLGWICVATLLDTAAFLDGLAQGSGSPLSPLPSAMMAVLLVAVAGLALELRYRDLAAPLAIAWGLLGVAVYRHSVAPALALLALVLSGALLLLVVSTARTSAHDRRRAFLEK